MGSPAEDVLLDDLGHHGRGDLPVGDLGVAAVAPQMDLHQRVHGAQTLAARAGDRSANGPAHVSSRGRMRASTPVCATSSSNAFSTSRLPAATPPVPRQMRMSTSGTVRQGPLCGAGLMSVARRPSRAAPRRRRQRSGRAVALDLGPERLDHLDRLLGGQLAVSPVVDHHHRSHAARAHAVHLFDRVEHVGGVLPGLDAQVLLDLLRDARSARHVARGAVAATDGVLRMGFQPELGIESGHAESLAERLAGRLGHPPHHVLGQIAEDGLRALQKGDQRPPSPL